jgi:hypothetical protein
MMAMENNGATSRRGVLLVIGILLSVSLLACVGPVEAACTGEVSKPEILAAEEFIIADQSRRFGEVHGREFRSDYQLEKSEKCGKLFKLTYFPRMPDDPSVGVFGAAIVFAVDPVKGSVEIRYLGE